MKRYAPEKLLNVPPFGQVDVSQYLPIIDSREFQRLDECTQLACVGKIYRGATHTRFLHSVAVMGLTRDLLWNMFSRGFFKGDEEQVEHDLCCAALVHDIGHGPYSHTVEYVLRALNGDGHKERTVEKIKGMDEVLARCGSSADRVIHLLDKKKKASHGELIWQTAYGMDKIGYVYMDQAMTGYHAALPPDVKEFMHYVSFERKHGVRIEDKAINLLRTLFEGYMSMWTGVYFRKSKLIGERMLMRAIEEWIAADDVDTSKIWDEAESWVVTKLRESSSNVARELMDDYRYRKHLKTALSVRIKTYAMEERSAGKDIGVAGVSRAQMKKIAEHYQNPLNTTILERKLAQIINCPDHHVLVSFPGEPGKIMPSDVRLVNKQGDNAGTLFERHPSFQASLQERADAFYAMRVHVRPELRQKTSRLEKELCTLIQEDLDMKLDFAIENSNGHKPNQQWLFKDLSSA